MEEGTGKLKELSDTYHRVKVKNLATLNWVWTYVPSWYRPEHPPPGANAL